MPKTILQETDKIILHIRRLTDELRQTRIRLKAKEDLCLYCKYKAECDKIDPKESP